MNATKTKIGIIGCGLIANEKHLPTLTYFNNRCEIVAVCDIVEKRARSASENYTNSKARVYTDYNELLSQKDVEVVYVLTPNVSHMPITVAAFEAGKHVMCEKPMAHSVEDAKLMMSAWKKSGKKFTIGYQNRFRPEIQELKKACERDELGEIYYSKAHAVRRRAVPNWGVFLDKAKQGGGPLIDIGTHSLDMTLWLMNNYKPVSVSGSTFNKMAKAVDGNIFGAWDTENFEVEDFAIGLVKMENGANILVEAAWALNIIKSKEASTTLCGTKSGATVDFGVGYDKNQVVYNRMIGDVWMQEEQSEIGGISYFEGSAQPGEHKAECEQWLNALQYDTEITVKPEQAYIVTKILEGIYKSAQSGKEFYFTKEED